MYLSIYNKNEIRTTINRYKAFIHSITESNGRKGSRASIHCRFVIITQRRKEKNFLVTEGLNYSSSSEGGVAPFLFPVESFSCRAVNNY
jgi:hypothetical protein